MLSERRRRLGLMSGGEQQMLTGPRLMSAAAPARRTLLGLAKRAVVFKAVQIAV